METAWIRDGLAKAGRSQADLARHLNITPPQVTRMLSGKRRIKADEINRIRDFLGLEQVPLTGPQPARAKLGPHGEEWKNPPIEQVLPQAVPVSFGPRDLPIYGAAECGPDGVVSFDDQQPVDWFWRAPELMGVRGAFAIYATGDSMKDAIAEGAVVMIHPHRGPLPDHKCLVLVRNQGAFLKIWIGRRNGRVVTRQTNPPKEVSWPEDDVQAAYRVIAVVEG